MLPCDLLCNQMVSDLTCLLTLVPAQDLLWQSLSDSEYSNYTSYPFYPTHNLVTYMVAAVLSSQQQPKSITMIDVIRIPSCPKFYAVFSVFSKILQPIFARVIFYTLNRYFPLPWPLTASSSPSSFILEIIFPAAVNESPVTFAISERPIITCVPYISKRLIIYLFMLW